MKSLIEKILLAYWYCISLKFHAWPEKQSVLYPCCMAKKTKSPADASKQAKSLVD